MCTIEAEKIREDGVGLRQAAAAAAAAVVLATVGQSVRADQPPPSGFGAAKPAILGITSDTTSERVLRLLREHADMWGARSKTLHEDKGQGGAYIQRLSLELVPQSNEERSRFGGNDTIRIDFSPPAAGNTVFWLSRELSFTGLTTPPSMAGFVARIFADYGKPTVVADGRLYFLYRKGQRVAPTRDYTPEAAVEALRNPRVPAVPPVIDAALGADIGRCTRAFEGPPVSRDIARLLEEATCDAALVVWLSGSEDRLRTATFQLNDLERRAGAAARTLR